MENSTKFFFSFWLYSTENFWVLATHYQDKSIRFEINQLALVWFIYDSKDELFIDLWSMILTNNITERSKNDTYFLLLLLSLKFTILIFYSSDLKTTIFIQNQWLISLIVIRGLKKIMTCAVYFFFQLISSSKLILYIIISNPYKFTVITN